MMLASGFVASAPSSAEVVGLALLVGEPVRELGDDPARQGDVAGLDLDARLGGVRLDDRQERVRREQRRLVGVRVDDPGHGCGRSCARRAASSDNVLTSRYLTSAGRRHPASLALGTGGRKGERFVTRLRPWLTPRPLSRRSLPKRSGRSSSCSSVAAPPSSAGATTSPSDSRSGSRSSRAPTRSAGSRAPTSTPPSRSGRRWAAGWPGARCRCTSALSSRAPWSRASRSSSWSRASRATTSATRGWPRTASATTAPATPGGRHSWSRSS